MKNEIDDLLNNVFGRRTILSVPNVSTTAKDKAAAPSQPDAPTLTLDTDTTGIASTQKAVQDMSRTLDAHIARQRAEIEQLNQNALADIARIRDELQTPQVQALAQNDTAVSAASSSPSKPLGMEGFDGLQDALERTVHGQAAYCRQLAIALKRPYVLGHTGAAARGVVLLTGPAGTGRRLGLRTAAQHLAQNGTFSGAEIAWMDLSLYPTANEEKLFLQDLYAALCSTGDIVGFVHCSKCYPGFLSTLSALAQKGEAALGNRYVLQSGRLIDTGNALAADAVRSLTPRGKYLVFLTEGGAEELAGRFGAGFVAAVSDVCTTTPLDTPTRQAVAQTVFDATAQRAAQTLHFAVHATPQAVALAADEENRSVQGAQNILHFWDTAYRALAQYKLEHDCPDGLSVTLDDTDHTLTADFGAGAQDLFALLPNTYTGDVQAVKDELAQIVGLQSVKNYVLSLEENVAVQQRRKRAGLKTASVSMHMIFTGNPGTGKTTVARLISRYLKALGVLSGGQLVEVTRADLVGKYVGHTAPLTTQVINSALGGVLFIDEAYSLYRGKDDSFGLECIDTLVKGMEDHRDNLLVILAGYTKEMTDFLSANSGLKSRFPHIIEFPDYTGAELLEIARLQALGKGYVIDPSCDAALLAYFNEAQCRRARQAGNGRLARNKVEEAILAQAGRIAHAPDADLCTLLPQDFAAGLADET